MDNSTRSLDFTRSSNSIKFIIFTQIDYLPQTQSFPVQVFYYGYQKRSLFSLMDLHFLSLKKENGGEKTLFKELISFFRWSQYRLTALESEMYASVRAH